MKKFLLLGLLLVSGAAFAQMQGLDLSSTNSDGIIGPLTTGKGGTGVVLPAQILGAKAAAVNLNSATTDTAITIVSPTALYRVIAVYLANNGTTASLTTATAGLFTSTGGGGVAVAANQVLSAVTSNTINTATNGMVLTLTSPSAWLNSGTLQFRVGSAQGASAAADIYIYIEPLP